MKKQKVIALEKDELRLRKQENKAREKLSKYMRNASKIERLAIQNRKIMQSIKRLAKIPNAEPKEI